VVLAVVALVTYARRVDPVEVVATILFMPIFVAFVFKGVAGGLVTAVAAIAAYGALRSPAIDAVGHRAVHRAAHLAGRGVPDLRRGGRVVDPGAGVRAGEARPLRRDR
jgi:hypothetical protein